MTTTDLAKTAPAEDADLAPVRTALLSCSDKSGLETRARALAEYGVSLISTGGTHRLLSQAGLSVAEVSDLTGFPEIMDGRVKTLHPRIHGGILARRDVEEHVTALADHGGQAIDLVVVNLYPFEQARTRETDFATIVENIDIGGPALIRGAAKNHAHVCVCVELEDLDAVLEAMGRHEGQVPGALRRALAAKAFARTAAYDAGIAEWLSEVTGEVYGPHTALGGTRALALRYGENPHQAGALYLTGDQRPGPATAELVQGKPLSYNNINDADAAFELVCAFDPATPTVAIIKHANPCGVATADSLADAYGQALACDSVSAFGGVIALNGTLDDATATAITSIFSEVIIAPSATPAALDICAKKKNVRVLLTGGLADPSMPGRTFRTVAGGFLAQDRDAGHLTPDTLNVVTERAPTDRELTDMLFAWRVAKHVKSNAIVYAKNQTTAGIGAGQMSRVDSARVAAHKAREAAQAAGWAEPMTHGSACASDAFFPFPDGLLQAAEAGATAVIQPGGSIRDEAVIAAANEAGLAMAFTGVRHFRH